MEKHQTAATRQNAEAIFLLTPPDTFDHPGHYDADAMLAAARPHRGKLVVVGGGGTLNAIIQQVSPDAVTDKIRTDFALRPDGTVFVCEGEKDANRVASLEEGMALAKETLGSGAAARKLAQVVEVSQQLKKSAVRT